MTWKYIPADKALNDAFLLRLPEPNGPMPGFAGGNYKGGLIEFQFPPKIVSDSRKGTWVENDVVGDEAAAAFSFTGSRIITINWSYVVDGGLWTVDRITHIVRTLRSYFIEARQLMIGNKNLVIFVKFWAIGGSKEMSARMKSVDIKHGETMVIPSLTSNDGTEHSGADYAYPLRTDISVDLRLWTKGMGEGGPEVLADINELKAITKEWY